MRWRLVGKRGVMGLLWLTASVGVMAERSVPPRPLAMANAIRFDGPSTAPAGSVRSLYVVHCAGCHSMDGSGHPAQGVPSMRGALGHFLRLPEGRAFLVQVPGVNNAGLSDAQIADLTNWMVPQFSADTAPPGWAPYRADEVAGYRARRPADVGAVRRGLVETLGRQGHEVR